MANEMIFERVSLISNIMVEKIMFCLKSWIIYRVGFLSISYCLLPNTYSFILVPTEYVG